uniref:NADPH oxidase 3 n=1 Tax=Paramormyrops kingsleyae TaxID=1676925 RepID=A0A3B3QDK7_9TELE
MEASVSKGIRKTTCQWFLLFRWYNKPPCLDVRSWTGLSSSTLLKQLPLLCALWQVLLVGVNVALFTVTFLYYSSQEAFSYTRVMLGSGLAFARASATCVNLNCMVILLDQLDKNITFHRVVGYLLVFHSVVHVIAHLSNIERYHESQSTEAGELLLKLSSLGDRLNESFLNPIRTYNTTPTKEVLVNVSGLSGLVITLVLALMVTSSTEFIRRSSYEVFWFTHHFFVVFLVGLVIHGIGGIVRGQTAESLLMHNVSYCREHLDEWGDVDQCPLPHFRGSDPASWKWIIAPSLLYICERILRFTRSLQPVAITKVVTHPSNVVELQMTKTGFRMEPGQYVYLQCPAIAPLEWHPFTLTSAPEEDHFSVHVRVAGDWTAALYATYTGHQGDSRIPQLRLAVDGPFGSASRDVFRYEVSVCIAAGIGVTPFASVLKSLQYKSSNPRKAMKLQKLYFFWICRDTTAFEWFRDLLLSLEGDTTGTGRLVSFHIYLTSWDDAQVRQGEVPQDVVTGFREKTFFGRPNWDQEFRSIADSHPGSNIGVFLCGPKAISKVIRKMCSTHSTSTLRGVHFHFNKERF